MGRSGRVARVVVVVVALVVVPGTALAQTTTTSTTSTTLGSTTTTVVATTTTTVAHPCTGRVCTAEPPGAVLSTASTELVPDRGSYCWLSPTDGTTMCLALAAVPGYQPPVLVVTQGELVTVRFTAPVPLVPQGVALWKAGERLTTLPSANPTQFRVDLDPGIHESVALITHWIQGEVPYSFRLDVRPRPSPPAPTVGRTLALTG